MVGKSAELVCPTSVASPIRAPHRSSLRTCGAFDMLSMPPATAKLVSPRRTARSARPIADSPERQTLLIVTEGTVIDHPASSGNPAVPYFYGDEALAGWERVLASVHEVGGKIIPQLWHVGALRKSGPNPDAPPVSPSGIAKPGERVGDPLTETEIGEIVDAYARAAAAARRLGFDGIEPPVNFSLSLIIQTLLAEEFGIGKPFQVIPVLVNVPKHENTSKK